ncbi:MAG: hypothetical protein ACOZIN_04000 [Myxococcota bacterium]
MLAREYVSLSTMKLRYRNLSSKFDPKAVAAVAADARRREEEDHRHRQKYVPWATARSNAGWAELGGAIAGVVSAPRQVSVEEGEAEVEELRELLRAGKLEPSDLVDDGSGWTTFAQHPLFAEDARERHGAPKWLVLAFTLGALGLFGLLLRAMIS